MRGGDDEQSSLVFDATRLVRRQGRVTPSGIDRVVRAYARWAINRRDLSICPVWSRQGRYVAMMPERFRRSLEDLDALWHGEAAHGETGKALLCALEKGVTPRLPSAPPKPDLAAMVAMRAPSVLGRRLARLRQTRRTRSVYLNVGHTGLEHPVLSRDLRSATLRSIVFVHDAIPITHAEFCRPHEAQRHRQRLEAASGADLVIVNSEATREDLRRLWGLGARTPKVVVAPLGLEPNFLKAPQDPPLRPAHPYFVHVGTIEARKNLSLLLAVWRRLAEQYGEATPRLVLIGARGWDNQSVLGHLERSDIVRPFVIEAPAVGDAALAVCLRSSVALLSPSFAEGYNLPVVEALALGTPVIASNLPAHREVSRGAATLIDPLDGPGWFRAIKAAYEAPRRAPAYVAPTWDDHFAIVGAALEEVRAGAPG